MTNKMAMVLMATQALTIAAVLYSVVTVKSSIDRIPKFPSLPGSQSALVTKGNTFPGTASLAGMSGLDAQTIARIMAGLQTQGKH